MWSVVRYGRCCAECCEKNLKRYTINWTLLCERMRRVLFEHDGLISVDLIREGSNHKNDVKIVHFAELIKFTSETKRNDDIPLGGLSEEEV